MPRRSFALLVAIPFLIGTLAAGVLFLTGNATAQTGAVRNVGAITISADNYEDLGFNRTRATGNIVLGRYLRVSGSGAYVEFDNSYLSGNGTIVLDSGGRTRELFSGSFGASGSDVREGTISPAGDVRYGLRDLSGFSIQDGLIFSRISTVTGIAKGQARLELPGPASNELGMLHGPPQANQIGVATAMADFQIAPSDGGPAISARLDPFRLPHAGLTLIAPSGASLQDGMIRLEDGELGSEALLQNRTTPIGGISINPNAVELDTITVPVGDLCFGQPCGTTRLKITGIQATLNGNQFSAEGNLVINLPGNQQSTRVILTFANAGGNPDGSTVSGTVAQLSFTIAGSQLTLQQIGISNNGLTTDLATLQLPASLGNSSGSVSGITINGAGLSVTGGSVTLPTIRIGDGSRVQIQSPTASFVAENGGYSFTLSGALALNLPQNSQTINISATINTAGQLSGTINQITLNIAGATLQLSNLALDETGLAVQQGTLNLPASLGGVSGQVNNVKIGRGGLSIGGGSVTVPFRDFSIGATNGFAVTGASLRIDIAADQTFAITLNGTIAIRVPGATSSATGSVTLNSRGNVSGSIQAFSLTVAGLGFSFSNATIDNNGFFAQSASLQIPASWGGAAASVTNLRITSSGLSIGGGSFTLPTIRAGGFTISASGALVQVSGGYEIRASGLFGMPGLSSGPGCSGIQAGLTLFTDSLGSTVLQIDPLDGPEDTTAAIEAIRAGDSELTEAELSALRLRQVSVSLNCKIPIGQTGFVVSRLSGSLTLNDGSTRVDVGVSIESSLSLPGLGAAVRGDVDAYVQSSPFEMGLNGSLYVFIFQVGGANIKISEARGFEATVFVQMVWGRGDLYVRAWSAYGQFNLTGRATISVGFATGSIWRGCLKYPCCSLPSCSWSWFAKLRCSGGGCSLCDGPCINVPPFNLNLGQVGAEFGRFTGDRWGFKGTVNVNFFGKDFGTGFFVDQNGNLTVGNVDNIRLVTSSQIDDAHAAFLAAENDGSLTADWNRNGIGFTQQGDATVTVPITSTSNVIFAMSRNQDTPKFTLISPNNTAIGPNALPNNVSYQEIITYTVAPNLTQQRFIGLAPELTSEVHVSGLYAKESDPTLAQACTVMAAGLTELIEQELGVTALDDEGQMRLVNATSDQVLIDILVNDQSALEEGVGVGLASLYDYFNTGTLNIKAVPAGKTTPVLAETTLVLAKDAIHTLSLVGGNGTYELFTYTDLPTAPPSGFGRVRFINLAANSGAVDVELVGRQLLFDNVGYSSDTTYVDVPVGNHNVAVSVHGSGAILQRSQLIVGDGDVITVLSLRDAASLQRLWLPQINWTTGSYIPPTPSLITPQQTGADQFAITNLLDVTPPAALRLVHGVRGAPAVDGSLSKPNSTTAPQAVFADIGYKGVSSYINSDPGELVVTVAPDGTTTPIFSGNTTLERDQAYSLIVLPGSSPSDSLLLRDNLSFPSVGNFKIRAVALDPDAAAVDLVLVSSTGQVTTFGNGLAYRSAGDYLHVPAGNYRIELRAAGGSRAISTVAAQDLKEGYIYSLFAFDGGVGAPSELVLNTDVAAISFIQEMYTITNADAGNWQMVATGAGQGGNAGEEANYLLQVIGSNPAPAFSQVTVSPTTGNKANVNWRLTSEEPDTRVNIYISPGPISAPVVITDTNGITSTVQVPVYGGGLVAADINSAVDGTPQSYEIDLGVAESGTYYVWIEADDGRNEPTRAYARKPGAAAGLADTNDRGEFILDQSDLETLAITRPWDTNWATANISVTEEFGLVKLNWAPFNNPDVDRYELRISGGDLATELVIDIGDKREFTADGLTPGVEYDFTVRALDEDAGLTATAPVVKATPATAPFNLSGPANLGTIGKVAASFELQLTNPNSGSYPAHIALTAENVPSGLAVEFSKVDNPTCGQVGVLEADLFCPAGSPGARVTMSVTPNGLARSGVYTITVNAVGGGVERSLNLPVTVQGGNFTLDLSSYDVQLPLPNIAAGQTAGPPVDITLTLNGFNDANNPAILETYRVPPGVQLSFLRNGQVITNPSIIAGQPVTVRLQAIVAPPTLRDPQNNNDPQGISGNIDIVGYASGHWNFAAPLRVQTFNPNPVLNRLIDPDPNNYEAFATAGGTTTSMNIELVVPAEWTGGNITLRPQAATLPPSTTVTLNGNPTATFSNSNYVTVNATVGAGVTAAWYYLNIEAVDSQNRVLYTLVTDFGVDIPNVDFDTNPTNTTFRSAFPGETISEYINIEIPVGWTDPVTVGLELDYTDSFAFNTLEAVLVDGSFNPIGSPVSGGNVLTIDSGPGTYTVLVTATVKPDATPGQRKIWYNLRSDPVWTESRIFVDVGYDFDQMGDSVPEQSSAPGQEVTYILEVVRVPASFTNGIDVAVDENLLDPEITVTFRDPATGNFVKVLNLPAGFNQGLEIRVSSAASTPLAAYWFSLDYRVAATPVGSGALLDYTDFVINITNTPPPRVALE